jgi:hypothetical protein
MPPWLPLIVLLDAFGGDWHRYLTALYQIFQVDWMQPARLQFRGKRIAIKRHPVDKNGMEATFWHLISTGEIEDERLPDIRRCERVGWPRAILDNNTDAAIRHWVEMRGKYRRVHLWCVDADYVFVLCDRTDYVLPWTGFHLEHRHQRLKFQKRWEQYG